MGLTAPLRSSFPPVIRRRGEAYFERGAVRLRSADGRSVAASVSGAREYRVKVFTRGGQLAASCDCPHFATGQYCKHIWATLRAVEAGGGLSLPENGNARLALPVSAKRASKGPEWRETLERLAREGEEAAAPRAIDPDPDVETELAYRIDVPATLRGQRLALSVGQRRRRGDGPWGPFVPASLHDDEVADLPDPLDRELLAMLFGAEPEPGPGRALSPYQISDPLRRLVVPLLCRTGRCRMRLASGEESPPLVWDDGPPWEFRLSVRRDRRAEEFVITGALQRARRRREVTDPVMLLSGGLAFFDDKVAALDDSGAFRWLGELRRAGTLRVPRHEGDRLLRALLATPRTRPRLDLPADLRFEELRVPPLPVLSLRASPARATRSVDASLGFDYGGVVIEAAAPGWAVWDGYGRRLLIRDEEAERRAAEHLAELDPGRAGTGRDTTLQIGARELPALVRRFLADGWRVRADGRDYRQPAAFDLRVSSGIDWFDLEGGVEFGVGGSVALPRLLQALRTGDSSVELDDGSLGLLPETWLEQHALLAELAETDGDHLRFRRNQVALLDALLASRPEASLDKTFKKARASLDRFEGIRPADPPAGFKGRLRDYQREGLAWLHFLREFGFGGCLADDMGLGKTVQVLALLESRRTARLGRARGRRIPPSLVVVPRSLVFNWKEEAARFTPRLRILDHTGTDRARSADRFADFDVVLTTYGTLRRDALLFRDVRFDYAILDEAQAIKNPRTASAKAARLLDAPNRLVLSGTPIENHIGELWSLFEFLNPGMLGRLGALKPGSMIDLDEERRALLARALRPFILRRTKAKVARDLPQRLEQTLYCEPDREQRALCDELREHYRRELLAQIDRRGLGRTKLRILEALLRMRQAACHPGLLDPDRRDDASAKLDVLLPRLVEVLEEGHKALVFSQFTSFLAILRRRLDEQGLRYEYLDGRTRDRASRVRRFQEDPECPLFLISLKAGGLGLNLTAAEYVFLLDPWWNPAAEAQAVDRTHRIGQRQRVFAYRLITRDTIEERVLELQRRKRSLADAIVTADESLVGGLERSDLEELLR